ncbi:hypothetical protein LIA77_01575 [Sarocladium implicatum]|nr:hypothetical protein LIA77_01575 [Sarocladium implicatum]
MRVDTNRRAPFGRPHNQTTETGGLARLEETGQLSKRRKAFLCFSTGPGWDVCASAPRYSWRCLCQTPKGLPLDARLGGKGVQGLQRHVSSHQASHSLREAPFVRQPSLVTAQARARDPKTFYFVTTVMASGQENSPVIESCSEHGPRTMGETRHAGAVATQLRVIQSRGQLSAGSDFSEGPVFSLELEKGITQRSWWRPTAGISTSCSAILTATKHSPALMA